LFCIYSVKLDYKIDQSASSIFFSRTVIGQSIYKLENA